MPNIADAFPSNYLKASDLKGRGCLVVIDRVEFEAVGQKKEMKPILYFKGKDKGLVLNKTNANKIMQITESPVTEEWQGCQIEIYPTETSFQGDMVDCIRVREVKARNNGGRPPKPVPVQHHEDEHDSITDEDIPFAWLMPLVLPLLGVLSVGILA